MSGQLALRTLGECEAVIERGLDTFREVGAALIEIRDRALYLETHRTFDAYCRDRWNLSRSRAYQYIDAGNVSTIVDVENEAQARELAPLLGEPKRLEEVWDDTLARTNGQPTARAIRETMQRPHVAHNSGANEWYTPPSLIAAARTALGGIDLDPASSAEANAVVQASRYFTVDNDGLAQEWEGRVWLNPPYAQPWVERFGKKLVDEYTAGRVLAACLLTNNTTETSWYQETVSQAQAVCMLSGRVRFWTPDRDSLSPLQGQTVMYFGAEPRSFAAAFGPLGVVLEPSPS